MIDHLSATAQKIVLAKAELVGLSEEEVVEAALVSLLEKVEGNTDHILKAKVPKTKKLEASSAGFVKIYAAECAVFAFCSEEWYSEEFREETIKQAVERLSSVKQA